MRDTFIDYFTSDEKKTRELKWKSISEAQGEVMSTLQELYVDFVFLHEHLREFIAET